MEMLTWVKWATQAKTRILSWCKTTSVLRTCGKKLSFHIWFSIYVITHLLGLPIGSGRNMYLFIYNKKEAGELMTKQNQMDIVIHKVSSHAYFHYKPELSTNTKHIHKRTHTHKYTYTHVHALIQIYTHISIKIEPHVGFSSSIIS